MKIRIKENSIRLRLTRGELHDICGRKIVTASTDFPGGERFRYELLNCAKSGDLTASFSDNTITIRAPEAMIADWAGSEQVSMRTTEALAGDAELTVLVEKDFACLAPREGEDESDMFVHPNVDKATC